MGPAQRRHAIAIAIGSVVAAGAWIARPGTRSTGVDPPLYAAATAPADTRAAVEVVLHDGDAPALVAHVAHARRVAAGDIVLADRDHPERWTRAGEVRDPRIAVALVVQDTADYLGVGSDGVRSDGNPGARVAIDGMLAHAALATTGAADSEGMIVGYGEKATRHVHLNPIAKLDLSAVKATTPGAISPERTTTGLVAAIELALHDLGTAPPSTRMIVLVGDGTAPATAAPLLTTLRLRADGERIERSSLAYGDAAKVALYQTFDPNARASADPEELLELGDDVHASLADRYDVDLPGIGDGGAGLDWDGQPHQLVLHLGELGAVALDAPVVLPGYRPPGPRTARAAFGALAIAGALLALFGLARLFVRAERAKPG